MLLLKVEVAGGFQGFGGFDSSSFQIFLKIFSVTLVAVHQEEQVIEEMI